MIKVNPECFPCFLKQVVTTCSHGGVTEELALSCLSESSRYLSTIQVEEVPARIATKLHEIVRTVSRVDDPFRSLKDEEMGGFSEMRAAVREKVMSSRDPVNEALFYSGVGNMFDYGIISRESARNFLRDIPSIKRGIFFSDASKEALLNSKKVGILLDNTGEAPFDAVLAEVLQEMGVQVWLGVKGGPVIDDITFDDASVLGLPGDFEVLSNGNRGVGTDLETCSSEFINALEESDLILSKGQANFETLWGTLEKGLFLFVCKCSVIEGITGEAFGTIILKDGREPHEKV